MEQRPFANATEFMFWEDRWCCRCAKYETCDIILRSMVDEPTPELVVEQDLSVKCTEFVKEG